MISYIQFEIISAIVFIIILGLVLYKNRKKLTIKKIVHPFLYIIMWRTQLGVKVMERLGKKYRELIKFAGLCGIGVGVVGLIMVFFMLFQNVYIMLTQPSAPAGLALALPYMNIPGFGIIGFWHWVIAIFILAAVHEFSHGIVAAAHGLKIKNSGPAFLAIFVPFLPAAFVEPDEKKLEKSRDVTQYSIFAAGPVSNIILGLIFLLILLAVFVPIELNISEPIGFSFKAIEGKPASEVLGIENRFTFTEFNGEQVSDANVFVKKLHKLKPGDEAVLANDGEIYTIKTITHPEDKSLPYLGIKDIRSERRYFNQAKGNIFSWFKNLIKWIALLNIFVGIANLLPLGPLDGGLILRKFLEKVCKKKQKAINWWGFISFLCLFLILLGFLLPVMLR